MTNYLLRQQMKAKEDRDTIEKAMRYTAEESHKVTMDAIATIKDSELRVQQLHTENEKLRKQIADMEVRHADRQSSDQKHIENYRDQAEKLKILQEDTEKQRAILRENLDERTVVADYARSRARELLGRLSKNDNNSKERAPHGPAFWEIIYRLKNSESPLSEDSIRHSVKALVDDVHRSLRVAERDKLVGKKNIDGADHYYLTPLGNEVAEIAPMPDRTGPGG